jgi:hypothetical protein
MSNPNMNTNPNTNYGMYEADREAKRNAQPKLPAVTGEGNAPRVSDTSRFYLGLEGDHLDRKAEQYVSNIRNVEKKRYARDTLNYIRFGDCSYLDSEYKLSAMAKQAVHLTFREIYPKGALTP